MRTLTLKTNLMGYYYNGFGAQPEFTPLEIEIEEQKDSMFRHKMNCVVRLLNHSSNITFARSTSYHNDLDTLLSSEEKSNKVKTSLGYYANENGNLHFAYINDNGEITPASRNEIMNFLVVQGWDAINALPFEKYKERVYEIKEKRRGGVGCGWWFDN